MPTASNADISASLKRMADEALASFKADSAKRQASIKTKAEQAFRAGAASSSGAAALEKLSTLIKEHKSQARHLQDTERDAAGAEAEAQNQKLRSITDKALGSMAALGKKTPKSAGGDLLSDDHELDRAAPQKGAKKRSRA